MTSEEIKRSLPMAELFRQYGIQVNRAGFAHCPFHSGDRTPSMKVYKDSFYCYGCHATGDVFTFVERMDDVDFKTAFIKLGGVYDKMTPLQRMRIRESNEAQARKRWAEEKAKERRRKELNDIDSCQKRLDALEPLSNEWCEEMDRLERLKRHAGFYDE